MPRDKEKRLSAPVFTEQLNTDQPATTQLLRRRQDSTDNESRSSAAPSEENNNIDPASEHEQFEIKVLDEVFDYGVDTLHGMMFADGHPFYSHFHDMKKHTNVNLYNFDKADSNGDRSRTIDYVIPINHPMGPKSAQTTEKQTILGVSRAGLCHVVDTECSTPGVPYGENFYLVNRFCFGRVSATRSRLIITSKIIYLKKVWGLVKTFIEKNVKSGVRDSYTLLANMLREESENPRFSNNVNNALENGKTTTSKKRPSPRPSIRKESLACKRACGATAPDPIRPLQNGVVHRGHTAQSGLGRHTSRMHGHVDKAYFMSTGTWIKLFWIISAFLMLMHAVLYHKLRLVEEQTSLLNQLHQNAKPSAFDTTSIPSKCEQAQSVVGTKPAIDKDEVDNWKHILSASAEIMANIHQGLLELEANIGSHARQGSFQADVSEHSESSTRTAH